jgi:hypothetical protein
MMVLFDSHREHDRDLYGVKAQTICMEQYDQPECPIRQRERVVS